MIDFDGAPWFIAADVCRALGLAEHKNGGFSHHTARLEPKTEKRNTLLPTGINGGEKWYSMISESALYGLVMRARRKNPEAAKFQDWVTREVLPAIRKDGGYLMGEEKVRSGEMSEDVGAVVGP